MQSSLQLNSLHAECAVHQWLTNQLPPKAPLVAFWLLGTLFKFLDLLHCSFPCQAIQLNNAANLRRIHLILAEFQPIVAGKIWNRLWFYFVMIFNDLSLSSTSMVWCIIELVNPDVTYISLLVNNINWQSEFLQYMLLRVNYSPCIIEGVLLIPH